MSSADSAASRDTGTTPRALHSAKPARHAQIYSSTSPEPVMPDSAEDLYNNSLIADFSSLSHDRRINIETILPRP